MKEVILPGYQHQPQLERVVSLITYQDVIFSL
jgi:hypothetical protein